MSDNGPCPWYGGIVIDDDGFVLEGYSAGMRGGKIWGYENAHRVPCFMRWPGGGIGGGRGRRPAVGPFRPSADAHRLLRDQAAVRDGLRRNEPAPAAPESAGRAWAERTLIVHNQRVGFSGEIQGLPGPDRALAARQPDDEGRGGHRAPAGGDRLPAQSRALRHQGRSRTTGKRRRPAPGDRRRAPCRYEAWWDDVVPRSSTVTTTSSIGSDRENPAVLHAHDAHREGGRQVWVIEAERAGEYAFRAFRWPPESGKKILETREGAGGRRHRRSRLRVGNVDRFVRVSGARRREVHRPLERGPDLPRGLVHAARVEEGLACRLRRGRTDRPDGSGEIRKLPRRLIRTPFSDKCSARRGRV